MKVSVLDFDPETHAGPLPSPCINVCQMDACIRPVPGLLAHHPGNRRMGHSRRSREARDLAAKSSAA